MSRFTMLQETFPSPYSFLEPQASLTSNRFQDQNIRDTGFDLNFPYRVFVPEGYEPNYPYPLVVWLHSDHSSEMELDGVMQALSTRNYVGIAPRANIKSKRHQRLFRWGSSRTECAVAEDLVLDCVQAAISSMSIHPDRIFLAGFGGGGTMAQWIGLKYANQVAGVASISGPLPKAPRALSNWKVARSLQVLFSQTLGSTLCTEDQLIEALRLSHRAGLGYQFVQSQPHLEGNPEQDLSAGADDLDSSKLAIVNRFLMGLVTGNPLDLRGEATNKKKSHSSRNANLEFRVN